ncbi:MAG: radical SAM family heme chaperone HemW [Litorivicinaceae bacterium]
MTSAELPLIGLYVHIPWCLRKCPYCDFNSHEDNNPPFAAYGQQLCDDLRTDVQYLATRQFQSVFFGGGTPSLMPPESLQPLFEMLRENHWIDESTEITLEANPGTLDLGHLDGYRALGINRLSIGIQTFDSQGLERLGRIHSGDDGKRMIEAAQTLGFSRLNVDLMHSLPEQTPEQALADLQTALSLGVQHLSWYQLTIEPNTVFYKKPPRLPDEATLDAIDLAGQAMIHDAGLAHYEVSAFAVPGQEARHNLLYWEFGDYLGLGAGAHGKVTTSTGQFRSTRTRMPQHYLNRISPAADWQPIAPELLGFECLLNGLRLKRGLSAEDFEHRTGLNAVQFRQQHLARADALGLLEPGRFQATALGWRHLNTILEMLI